MTFREKSAAIIVAGLVLTYGFYGWRLSQGPMATAEAMALLTALIALQTVITILAHSAAALLRKPEKPDERDRLIELRGLRNGYFVLVAAVVGVMVLALSGAATLAVVNVLLGGLVAADLTRYGSQLVYYRLGL
jgi:hypothetical protein